MVVLGTRENRLIAPRVHTEACRMEAFPLPSGSSRSNSSGSADAGGDKLIGPRRVSKRREKSEGHLYGVVNSVTEHLNLGARAVAKRCSTPLDSKAVASSSSRSCVSLKFPRSASAPTVEPEDHTAKPATAKEVPANEADELEELRLQNAVLRKDLAILQQSVVESMKGDKAQFVGGGYFKTRTSASTGAIPSSARPPRGPAVSAAQQDADLEALRAALSERRAAVRTAIAERDAAMQDADEARRQVADLRSQHGETSVRLEDCLKRLEDAQSDRARAEGDLKALAVQADALKAELERAREEEAFMRAKLSAAMDEIQALRREAAASQAKLEAQCEAVDRDTAQLREQLSSDRMLIDRLMSQRKALAASRLASILRPDHSLKIHCLAAWFALKRDERRADVNERLQFLEAECGRLEEDCRSATADKERACVEAASAREKFTQMEDNVKDSIERARFWERRAAEIEEQLVVLDEQLQESRAQRHKVDGAAENELRRAEERISALEEEVIRARAEAEEVAQKLEACQRDAAAAEEAAAAAADEAAAREASLLEELEICRRGAECAEDPQALAAREEKLKQELKSAEEGAAKAREAQAAAQAELKKAEAKIKELDAQHRGLAAELSALRATSAQAEQDSKAAQRRLQVAETRAQEAERRANEQRRSAVDLQARVEAAEKLAASESQRATESMQALKAMQAAHEQAAGLTRENSALAAELSEARLSLAEARSNARSASEQLRQLREEHKALTDSLEKARREAAEGKKGADFSEEARLALEEARKRIRIMVTAPKVAVNIGKGETLVHIPFAFEAIKQAVQTDIMPRFARVFAVDDAIGDGQLRHNAQDMAQELAVTLQSKVYELLPQAEGTCNWDGFGARCSSLGAS